MFASNVQFGYPCPRGGGQAVQAGYLAHHPGFGPGSIISQFLFTIILEYVVVRDITLFQLNWDVYIQRSVWLLLSEGWGGGGGDASCPGWFILHPPHPAQDLGQTVSYIS